jgi:hypothetical protein
VHDDDFHAYRPPLMQGSPENPSHGDIMRAVNGMRADMGVLIMDMKGLKTELAAVVKCLGKEDEDEHGNAFGTGLVGRHMRLQARVDKRFRLYDDWRNYAIATFMTASMFIGIIWWIVEKRIEQVLR